MIKSENQVINYEKESINDKKGEKKEKKRYENIRRLSIPLFVTLMFFLIDSKFFSALKEIDFRELIYIFFIGGMFSLIVDLACSVNELKQSSFVYSSDLEKLKAELLILNSNLTKGIRKIENDEIYPFSIRLLQNEPDNKNVFVFKSYNQKIGMDDDFLKDVLKK